MRDYESVVKSLRCCVSDSEPCEHCNCELEECNPKTIMEIAANAIEEVLVKAGLWHRRYQLEHEKVEKLRSAVPKWISVEERLPSRYETVLLHIRTYKDSYVTIGDYEPNELRFRDFGDRNNQVYCGDVVTHWASLPEAPREEI